MQSVSDDCVRKRLLEKSRFELGRKVYSDWEDVTESITASPRQGRVTEGQTQNAEFLAPHPNIYVFVQALLRQQTATYIATGSLSFTRRQQRADRDKYAKQLQFYTDYRRGILNLKEYLQRSAYRVAP